MALQGLGAIGSVVGAGVAADDHGGARRHGIGEVVLDEPAERSAVVAVPVVAQHAASFDETVDVDLVLRGLEQVGHLGDAVDEGEAAHPAQFVVQRVHQREGELGELGHRSADVAEQHELRAMGMASPHDDIERHTTGLQRPSHGSARIEPAGAAQPAVAADPRRQLSGERLYHAAKLAELQRRELQHVAVGQRGADLDVGAVGAPRHQPGDLGGQPTTELLEHLGELVARQHQLELGQLAVATQLLHRRAEHAREVDGPHHPVQVVALAVLVVAVEPGERIDGLLRQQGDLRVVALLHRCSRAFDSWPGVGAIGLRLGDLVSTGQRSARAGADAANTTRKARSNSPVGSELLTRVARSPALTASGSSSGRWVSAATASITDPVVTSIPRRRS